MELWLSKMAYVLVTALCLFPCANAQTNGGAVLTLDEALLLAKSKNRDLKQFGLDVGKQREAGFAPYSAIPVSGPLFGSSLIRDTTR
jgi:hypothetical protein